MKKKTDVDVAMTAWRTNKVAEAEGLSVEVAQGYLTRLGFDSYVAARLARVLPPRQLPDATTAADAAATDA